MSSERPCNVTELTPEEINENFARFRSVCEKLGDRVPAVLAMLDELEERLALAPASAKTSYHCAYPGGLCAHSLRVLNGVLTVNKAFEWGLKKESMIIVSLFHDLGKLGLPGEGNEYYVSQKDDWRRNKLGEMYGYNDNIPYMTTGDRTMYMLQHYGVKLTPEEWIAIRISDGYLVDENKPYGLKSSKLAMAVQMADYKATMDEGNTKRFWNEEE